MRFFLTTIIFFLFTDAAFTQGLNIQLSDKHERKLSSIKSGHEKILKYNKYRKRDSVSYAKESERILKEQSDSIWRSNKKYSTWWKRAFRRSAKLAPQKTLTDSLNSEIEKWHAVYKDSTSSDSLRSIAKNKLKVMVSQKAKLSPGFEHVLAQHGNFDSLGWSSLSNQVPGIDTLAEIFDNDPDGLFTVAEQSATNSLQKQYGSFNIPGTTQSEFAIAKEYYDQLPETIEKYSDMENAKQAAEEKATNQAVDYFSNHTDALINAQSKVSNLLSKYREFSNSTDLSDAVKRTSMDGKTLAERVAIGANINVISLNPLSLDISAQLGYRFNTRFIAGAGMSYRISFGDSIKASSYVSTRTTSFDVFASYDIIKNFFAYAEWKKSKIARVSDTQPRTWVDNYFIGVGRKFLVHPKLYMTLTALYNLNGQNQNPAFAKRFQVRLGFQLSELAIRKRKYYYNANR